MGMLGWYLLLLIQHMLLTYLTLREVLGVLLVTSSHWHVGMLTVIYV